MNQKELAQHVITSLRKGMPPRWGYQLYSVGHEKLIKGFKKHHMSQIANQGLILFINGSNGSGKTHLFRLLTEIAMEGNCLVSNVQLHARETPFSKFEKIFSAIVRNIQIPSTYKDGAAPEAEPFARVLDEALFLQVTGAKEPVNEITNEQYHTVHQALMGDRRIDFDFRKIVAKYWETYVPNRPVSHPTVREEVRGEALQWFSGEGTQQTFRTRFDVNKMITGETARPMLQSLAGFVGLAGYRGLMIFFDEAAQAYQFMQPTERVHAYNNLFQLVNEIEKLPGLFLVYAATPDFYTNTKYGIVINSGLATRIGKLRDNKAPRAMDPVWNLDAKAYIGLDDYKQAAANIRDVYKQAYEDEEDDLDSRLPSQEEIGAYVEDLANQHGDTAIPRFWRVLMRSLIQYFEDCLEGEIRSAEEVYEDVMDFLSREE